MEDDVRYKFLIHLSKQDKLSTKYEFKITNEQLDELYEEGFILKPIGDITKFYRITLKGHLFLKEYKQLSLSTWLNRWQKIAFFPVMAVSLGLSITALILQKQSNNKEPEKQLKQKEVKYIKHNKKHK